MYIIDDIKPSEIIIFLAKPDKTRIGKLVDVKINNFSLKSEEVNEISFDMPYMITVEGKTDYNPHYHKIKNKFLIEVEYNNHKEWFTIEDVDSNVDGESRKTITCRSLAYQLNYFSVEDYEVISYNCSQVSDDILKNTGWTTGYVNPKFNSKFRMFNISSQTVLATVYEVAETFDAIPIFDTYDKTVSYYEQEELSQYKGFEIGYGKYIQSIGESISSKDIVTRLYVYGSDGLTINSVNPTGQSYIDDFSFFLYPFEMDEEGNVIKHSDYMSDNLAKALVSYNEYATENESVFSEYLEEKSELQKETTAISNDKHELEIELQIVTDAIRIAKETGEPTKKLIEEQLSLNEQIRAREFEISELEAQIEEIDSKIQGYREDVKMDKHLTEEQLDELYSFIQVDEWTDDNHFDVNDLYEAGVEELSKISHPPVDIETSLVNFLKMTSEQHNWDKLSVHDIVRINHEILDIDIKARIKEIDIDFEGNSIGVVISNSDRARTIEDKLRDAFYTVGKVNTDYSKRKVDWDKVAHNFNRRNDRIEKVPVKPRETIIKHKDNDDGSVNLLLSWDYPEYDKTNKDEHNIDGFLIYMYSDDTDEYYQFTTKMSQETMISVPFQTNAYTFTSVPSNLFYTVGVRAYRRVDDDINPEGILMSDIVEFSDGRMGIDTFNVGTHEVTPANVIVPKTSYQPSPIVNVKGRLNNMGISSGKEEPSNPTVDDIWFDTEERSFKMWDGEKWSGDLALDEIKDLIGDHEDELSNLRNELENKLDEVEKELEESKKIIDDEMERIENEVVPEIERVVEETEIPRQAEPPAEVPASGLWWNTETNRMMRWDEDSGEWIPLAPNEEEIGDMIDEMRDSAVAENRRYSKVEIKKARKNIEDKIDKEFGDVVDKIEDLEKIRDELLDVVETIDEILDEYDGRFENFEVIVDELSGEISVVIEDYERIDNIVEGHTAQIDINTEAISTKVGSIEYEEDKEGILTSIENNETEIGQLADQINLAVTREEWENSNGEFEERITEAEAAININAEAIELKAERTELENYVEHSEYSNKIGELEVSIDEISGRVEHTEAEIDTITGDYTEFKQQYAEFKLEVDSFTTKVGELSDIDGTLVDNFTEIKQEVDSITSVVSRLESGIDDLEEEFEAVYSIIEQLPEEINIAVVEGIADLEIGGTNLITHEPINWRQGRYYPNGTFQSTNAAIRSQLYIEIEGDKEYTLTTYGDYTVYINFYSSNTTRFDGVGSQLSTNDSITFTTPEDAKYFDVYVESSGENITIDDLTDKVRVQLEKGGKSTDWSLSPEDAVTKSNVLSSINLSEEGIKIEGAKIDMIGVVEFINTKKNLLPKDISGWDYLGIMAYGTHYIPVKGNTTYTLHDLSTSESKFSSYLGTMYDNNGNPMSGEVVSSTSSTHTFRTPYDAAYFTLMLSVSSTPFDIRITMVEGEEPLTNADLMPTMISGGTIATNSITANQLNVNRIFANEAVIAEIQAGAIATAELDAGQITAGTLDAGKISVVNLSGESIIAGSIDVDKLDVQELSSITANLGHVKAGTIEVLHIMGGDEKLYFGESTDEDSFEGRIDYVGNQMRFQRDRYTYYAINPGGEDGMQGATNLHNFYMGGGDRRLIFSLTGSSRHINIRMGSGGRIKALQGSIEEIQFRNTADTEYTNIRASETASDLFDVKGAGVANGIQFPDGHIISTANSGGHFYFYGNRSSGNPFVVRTHANRSNYRNDFSLNTSGEIISLPTVDNAVTWAGRAAVGASSGRFGFVSSSERYKLAIEEVKSDPYDLLKVVPKSWYDKGNTEEIADALTKKFMGEDYSLESSEDLVRIPGLIAEEVARAGLEEFVTYDKDGKIDGVQYDRIWTLLIPIVADIVKRIEKLENR